MTTLNRIEISEKLEEVSVTTLKTVEDLKLHRELIIEFFNKETQNSQFLQSFMKSLVSHVEMGFEYGGFRNLYDICADSMKDYYYTGKLPSEKENLKDRIGEMNLNEEFEMNQKGYELNPITRQYQNK